MVSASITARDQLDNGLRIWGLAIDTPPTGNWLKDASVIKASKNSGDLWSTVLAIPDGRHTLYLIISTTQASNGTYSGEALFDTAGFSFEGVDNDSVAAFDVNVKGGKATRASSSSRIGPTDVNTESPYRRKLLGLYQSIKDMRHWNKSQTAKFVGSLVAVGTILVVGYIVYKRMRMNGFRRGF